LANKLGFITQGFFLMGYPQETIEDIRLTRRFIKSVPFDKVVINFPFPYPGTGLFEYYIKNRYLNIKNINWATFKEFKFERINKNISSDNILKERKDALVKFYTNPLNIGRFFLKFKTWVQIKSAFYGFMVWLDYFRGNR
jgi:anaerobic magnesium-protoporphyrin IX monomethyl ester cyclase